MLFPTDDILNSAWLKRCSIIKPLVSHRVCNLHFLPVDIKENGLLMPRAVPSLHLSKNLHTDLNHDINFTSAVHMNNEYLNANGSPQRSQPSTYSELNTLSPCTPVERLGSMDNPRYFNDLSDKHFSTPRRAKRNLTFAKKKHNDTRKKLKIVEQRNRRLIKKVKTYEDLIKTLQHTNLLSENASQFLQSMGTGSLMEIVKRKLSGIIHKNIFV
ncbi:THAP-type domain-containing protein [Aphis craccivora]|uniref:THAP-type domain-containing protein n=1 Tax=Aphis craccivora TaxID=307492 RepID=A0A6G0YXT5_APHCR|nr:THAP-type domain-containing protein [Aphis craccivora]